MRRHSRPINGCHRPTPACERLEPRRLLAVALDPTFGGGDGFVLLRSPFDYVDTNGEGVEVRNPVFPVAISELANKYFVVARHNVLQGDDSSTISAEAVHALVTKDGLPSGALSKDGDGDGLAFFTLQEWSPGQFTGTGAFLNVVPLPDGRALAHQPQITGPKIVRLQHDGTEDPFFGPLELDLLLAMDLVTAEAGVVLTVADSPAAEPPIGPEDFIHEVQLFDAITGKLLGEPVRPFGEWLSIDQAQSPLTLHTGQDGAVYVAALTEDLDGNGDGGFLISRLVLDGQENLRLDENFGTTTLPGQTTPAVYMSGPAPVSQAFELIDATSEGRVWIRVPHPDTGTRAKAFALLTPEGQLDPEFGESGVTVVDFVAEGFPPVAPGSPVFLGTNQLTQSPRPFVRADGSLVGVTTIASSTTLPAGGPFEFLLGVYGVLPDGSMDPRIAAPDSLYGAGRAVVTTDVDGSPGTSVDQVQAAVYMDENERLVIVSESVPVDLTNDGDVPLDLMVGRILLDVPRVETVVREDGQSVFEVEGTSGDDRLILRGGDDGMFRLFSQPPGAPESLIGIYSSTDIDIVEMMGGEGNDVLSSELGEYFPGFVTLFGGNGSDTLSGDGRYTRLFGEAGDDYLSGRVGDQLLFGGLGNDTLVGGSGRDALYGEEGDDVLRGQQDGDYLEGGPGNDTLAGDEGDDTLVGGEGDDSMVGNAGIDLVSYAGRTVDLGLSLGTDGNGPVAGFESDFIGDDVENIVGGAGNDLIVGNDGRNFLLGGAGNDTLRGMGGKDTLLGGPGADLMDGGDDSDLLIDDDAIPSSPPFPTIGSPDTLIGGGGLDFGLIGSFQEDETEEVERVFDTLEGLLEVLDAE